MSQRQAILPFNHRAPDELNQFIGNDAVLSVLKTPVELPQFVYLWGVQYTGKTHLLQAVENLFLAAKKTVFSLPAVQLLSTDLVAVLPAEMDCLMLDDVHTLAASTEGELALFNLFNHCKSRHIKLLVTANMHPKDNAWQLPDLVSRLTSGLTLMLEPLKGQAAFDCLEKQFEYYGLPLDEPVMHYIKTHCSSAYSELYKLFLLVAGESLQLKRKVTVPLIKHALTTAGTGPTLNNDA